MAMLDWMLDADPAIRWQALRDLTRAPADVIATERARVATEGWGARLLARRGEDGQWAGGAYFPADARADEQPDGSQPWTATTYSLLLLRDFGVDPADDRVREAIARVRANCRWQADDLPFFAGEVEPCINGMTMSLGAYFGEPVDDVVTRLLGEQLADGGWNCRDPLPARGRRRPAQPVEHAARAAGPQLVRAVGELT